MTFISLLSKIAAYGCIGWIVEIVFTGLHSLLIQKNRSAVATSYLWMFPVYGLAGVVLEAVQDSLTWPWYLKPLVYLPLIYGIEGVSGWAIRRLIGKCPWEYPTSKWTIAGLVHLGYFPFWLILGLLFDPITGILNKVIRVLAAGY